MASRSGEDSIIQFYAGLYHADELDPQKIEKSDILDVGTDLDRLIRTKAIVMNILQLKLFKYGRKRKR